MWKTPVFFLILSLCVAYTLSRVMALSAQVEKRARDAARLEIRRALKNALIYLQPP